MDPLPIIGAALQVGGAVAGNAASRAELENKGNANSQCQEAYREWSNRSQDDERRLQWYLGNLVSRRFQDYGTPFATAR